MRLNLAMNAHTVPQLRLSIRYRLTPHSGQPTGTLFHCWLPNGNGDAITLSGAGAADRIRVWFERHAKIASGFLEWEQNGSAFDETIMRRQAVLDGGYLFGDVELATVDQGAIDAMRRLGGRLAQEHQLPEEASYVALGKRVLHLVVPLIVRFVDTLRSEYGQFWLLPVRSWDSRDEALGSACSRFGLHWWDDAANTWCRFLPTNLAQRITLTVGPGRGYAEYLTEADWRRLQATGWQAEPFPEVQMLGRATRLLAAGELRHAFIEVVAALELAISHRLRVGNDAEAARAALQTFLDRSSLKSQAAVLFHTNGVPDPVLEAIVAVIDIRNKVVHEGYVPQQREANDLRLLMRETARLCGIEDLKIPELHAGNRLDPPG